jgi:hypothetical protein
MTLNTVCHYAECHLWEVSFMLSVINKPIMLSVIGLSVVMLSVFLLSDFMLSVIVLIVGAPKFPNLK